MQYTNLPPPPPKKKKQKQKGLKELKHREDIFITNADKGGAAVILDIRDYNKGSEKQLNDIEHHKHFYSKIQRQKINRQ